MTPEQHNLLRTKLLITNIMHEKAYMQGTEIYDKWVKDLEQINNLLENK